MELPFNDPEFEKAWDEWIAYRRERKLPKYVPTGLKKTFTRLKNLAENDVEAAIKIINYSIEQNYQGLFPLKNDTHQQNIGNTADKPGTSAARIAALKKW